MGYFRLIVYHLTLTVLVGGLLLPGSAIAQTGPSISPAPGANPGLRLQLKDENARKKLLLSSLLGRLKKTEDAASALVLEQAIWKIWLKSGSPTIDLLMSQVVKSMGQRNYRLALKLLDRIVELAPEFSEGWNKRATVLYITGQFQASLDDIERVLVLEPRHFGALSGMGLVMQQLGDKKGALGAFREALNVHPYLGAAKKAIRILEKEVEGQGI